MRRFYTVLEETGYRIQEENHDTEYMDFTDLHSDHR